MELTTLLAPETRIIDVGVRDPGVARLFAARGHHRYLGLVEPPHLGAVRADADAVGDRFQPLTLPEQVTHNSADLLMLRGRFTAQLWSLGDVDHVRHVAVEVRTGAGALEGHLARLAAGLTGRGDYRGRYRCGDEEFDVVEIAGRTAPRARRYLSPVWGVQGFIDRLEARGARYLALRWFETLPELEPGEDLDLLVADEDLDAVAALLAEEPGTMPVDLYSATGLPGTDYQGMAYYPPALARRLLEHAVVHTSGCRVPAPLDHLHSLAYHAVYHKGVRSGLPSTLGPERVTDPEHDYTAVLTQLARRHGVELTVTLEGVDEYLTQVGWCPPADTMRRLATTNPWLEQRHAPGVTGAVELPEPAVFLVRERTLDVLSMADVEGALTDLGFEILEARDLDEAARRRCADQTRGGNWGRGPFAESGGPPAAAVVALHYGPRPPGASLRARYPRLSNGDVLEAKLRIRDLVTARLPVEAQFNPVHSSDDEDEAWEYLELALPQAAADVRETIGLRRADYRTDQPVVRELSRGRRAKVEVVRTEQGPAVRKTFAPTGLRHMQRELAAMRELAPHIDAVPGVLDRGDNWFLCPWFDDRLQHLFDQPGARLVPLRVARGMTQVLRQVHALGFDLVDAKPQNFLLDPHHGLKLVDFEFFHRLPDPPPPFEKTSCFAGLPPDFDGDVPVGELGYEVRWRPFTGLSLEAMLTSPVWSQHVQRAVFRLQRAAVGRSGALRRTARSGRSYARRGRRRAGRAYRAWARRRALLPWERAA